MAKVVVAILVVLCHCDVAKAFDMSFDTLSARMDMQRYLYPQEKIHITTDKEHYMAGDTIWLRAFVVDASSHQPVYVSKYVYVELRTPFNAVEKRIKIIRSKDGFCGCVTLDAKMAEGFYMLTAYTMFMENAGQDYFFKKQIEVSSPFSSKIEIHQKVHNIDGSRKLELSYFNVVEDTPIDYEKMSISYPNGRIKSYGKGSKGKTLNLNPDDKILLLTINGQIKKYLYVEDIGKDYDVTFMPEGGYLVPNVACKVAFKSIGSNGMGHDVKGVVTDADGNIVTHFKSRHRGMGVFTIVAKKDSRYKVLVTEASGYEKDFDLPMAAVGACVLHVDATRKDGKIRVSMAGGDADKSYNVLVQVRGILALSKTLRQGGVLLLDRNSLPAGVAQILLLDDSGNVLSERLIFGGNHVQNMAIRTDKNRYGSRELVKMDLRLMNEGKIRGGNVAVSVTDNSVVARDSSMTILTNMLLQSDLRGYIEDVAYYFDAKNEDALNALDELLMTQGWSRYDIPCVLKGRYDEPKYPIEVGQEISGTIKSYWKNSPLSGASANMIVPRFMYVDVVKTDAKGRFSLNGFDFPDSTKFVLQALNKKGKNEMNFEIDEIKYPKIENHGYDGSSNAVVVADLPFVSKEYARLNVAGLMSVLLNEIEVSAYRSKRAEDVYNDIMVEKSIDYKFFEERRITSYDEALRQFHGVSVDWDSNVLYRRAGVTFVIDGVVFENLMGSGSNVPSRTAPAKSYKKGTEIMTQGEPAIGSGVGIRTKLSDIEAAIPFNVVRKIDFVLPHMAGIYGLRAASGGAIVITTKDGSEDVANNEPSQLKTITPLGYQCPCEFYNPRYDVAIADLSVGSDLRSTVYWNPSVKIGAEGISELSFYANDSVNTGYTITVEGVTNSGEVVREVMVVGKD